MLKYSEKMALKILELKIQKICVKKYKKSVLKNFGVKNISVKNYFSLKMFRRNFKFQHFFENGNWTFAWNFVYLFLATSIPTTWKFNLHLLTIHYHSSGLVPLNFQFRQFHEFRFSQF